MTTAVALTGSIGAAFGTPAPAIEVRGLTKGFGRVPVLRNVEFTVPRGGVCAVLGGAGTGKTTLLQILAGNVRPTGGEALVCGIDVAADGSRSARRVGLLQQAQRFFGWMTGREALQYAGRFCSLGAARIDERAAQLLAFVELSTAADQQIETFSAGMRQRLGIAQALMGSPAILLLDEPVTGLDPAERNAVLQVIDQLRGGITVLFSSRDMLDLPGLANVVVVLGPEPRVIRGTAAGEAPRPPSRR